MGAIINASIDLSKVDGHVVEKNGKKWLNMTISVNDQTSEYGSNVGICLNQTKEQREAKEPKVFIGNGSVVWNDGKIENATKKEQSNYATPTANAPIPSTPIGNDELTDILPF